jgi:lysozyme family protein
MARDNFDRALVAVLRHEGGYVNHPADPGGATNKGVIQRTYDGFRKRNNLPTRSVRQITDIEVREIYKRQYWQAVRGDELPKGVDYMVFDGAVNSGPSRSIRWLQAGLGVKVDGTLGDATIEACLAHPNHDALIAKVCEIRMGFLRALNHWPTFGKGWTSRVAGVKKLGQAMATGKAPQTAPLPPQAPVAGSEARAPASNIDKPSEKQEAAADALAGAGGAGAVISGAAQQLEPVKESSPVILYIFIGLTVASVVLMAAGFGWQWYNARKAKRAQKAMNSEAVAEVGAE